MRKTGRLIFFLLVVVISNTSAQFKYSAGLASGLYFTDASSAYNKSQNYLTGHLKIGYALKDNRRSASINLFALPEFFSKNNSVRSVKLKIDANYLEYYKNLTWGVTLSKKNYFYTGTKINNNYDIYFLQSMLDWKLSETTPARSTIGIAYQDISGTYDQKSDLIFLDQRFFYYFNPYTHINYGLYLERFSLSSSTQNSGWRFGPALALNYLKDYVFNAQIKFLIHSSELTSEFSYQYYLRLVAGKFLFQNFSLFFMADYSWRNFNYDTDSNILPYSLIDSENNIHLKLGYNTSKSFEIFLKGGFFNQDFLERDLSLKGWNIIAGFKLSN